MRFASALALCCLSGCTLYFGNGDDETCGAPPPSYDDSGIGTQVRDPYTGECYGGGGGGGCYFDEDCNYTCSTGGGGTYTCSDGGDSDAPCDSDGNPSTRPDDPPEIPIQSGASCNSYCDGLTEGVCLQTAGCQVAYDVSGIGLTPYIGCWATDYTSPEAAGACTGLDAYSCSTRDDCTMNYDFTGQYPYKTEPTPPEQKHEFAYCGTEGGGYGCAATDCAPGYHCVDSCWDAITPDGGTNSDEPWPECTATCVPDHSRCDLIDIDCGPGYQCADICDVTNDAPMGGTANCYASCVPTTACEALTTQQACDARGDCTSVFDGDNCTCYESGYCECETLTWDRCEGYGANGMGL